MTTLNVEGFGECDIDRVLSWRVWPKGREFPYLRIQVDTADGETHSIWYEYAPCAQAGDPGFLFVGTEEALRMEQAFGDAVERRKAAYQPGEDEGSQA